MTCDEARFLHDVCDHQMQIHRNDGVYRHLQFSKGNSSHYRFDLITWPGCLCIRGDCGTFVFSRTTDMFNFFRMDDPGDFNHRKDRKIQINPGYWAEKELSRVPTREYCPDKTRAAIEEYLVEWAHFNPDEGLRQSIRDQIEEDIEPYIHEGGVRLFDATCDFKHESGFTFADFWDYNLTVCTFDFMWCCYAIAWGIQQYDAA